MLNESLFAEISAILCPISITLAGGKIVCVCVNATYEISLTMDRFLVEAKVKGDWCIGWNFHLEAAIDAARTKVLASV